MIAEKDIYITAQTLITNYGDGAESFATIRIEELKEIGDDLGADIWASISTAIAQLRKTSGDTLH